MALLALQDEGHKDLDKLEKELDDLKSQLVTKKERAISERATLQRLLQQTAQALKLKREKQIKLLDAYLKEYRKRAGEKAESIRRQTDDIKKLPEVIPKPK